MLTISARAVVLAGLAFPMIAQGQTRGFVTRLGTDTISIERIVRTGNKVEGTILRHSPATLMLKYSLSLNKDGTVAAYQQGTYRADGSPAPTPQTGIVPTGMKMTFVGDSVIREVVQNGAPVVKRNAAPRGTLPAIGGSWYLNEMAVAAAKKSGAGAYRAFGFGLTQDSAARIEIRSIGTDSAEIVQQGFRTGIKLDRRRRVIRGDGSLTTQKLLVTAIKDADVTQIATAWAARDAAGQGMGRANLRDTVNADVAGAKIWIDYGRPAQRGREIWGKLVPFDTTWRMGADAAAQIKTDKDLDFGGVTVPAGHYTIWLAPSKGKSYMLINKMVVNKQGIRVWGTEWDPAMDLVKVPVEQHMNLPAQEERFRIFVQGDMLMMHWGNGGYGVKVKAK